MARTPVAEHEGRVRALLAPLRTRDAETVPLAAALGRVLAGPVVSPINLPPFRNSQMDGVAVVSSDVSPGVSLPIVAAIPAAAGAPAPLVAGTVARIMTGAPLPEGADAVVAVEDTVVTEDGWVTIAKATSAGSYVREVGSDLHVGEQLLPGGLRLGSRHLAALAAAGLTEVAVESRVRVAIISTGSELVAPGELLGPGQISDSNGPALVAAAREVAAEVVLEGRVVDDHEAFEALLVAAIAADAELILTSGGISQGDYEVVRETLEPHGALVDVLAMQPGGPQAIATYREVPVVCFPGNPVSSQLSFLLFVEPLLREIAGLPDRIRVTRVLEAPMTSVAGKRQFLRGRALPDGRVETVGGPSSHLVAALAAADVLIDLPEDATELPAGASVETWEL